MFRRLIARRPIAFRTAAAATFTSLRRTPIVRASAVLLGTTTSAASIRVMSTASAAGAAAGGAGALQKTASGLQYVDHVVGTGARPAVGDTIRVHYTGTLDNGTVFDSSVKRGEPLEFSVGVGQVIRGWDEGLLSMAVGGKRKLVIPPSIGYGNRAVGPIPAGSTLTFEVELVEVVVSPEEAKLAGKTVVTHASGLKYVDEVVGAGAVPNAGQTVSVHYTGRLASGAVFDSSRKAGRTPFEFRVGAQEVIAGWDIGVGSMHVGGKRVLIVPPKLGYGARGAGPIPGNSTLYFDVELLAIKK